jgi:SAM-dependent methyltransferase
MFTLAERSFPTQESMDLIDKYSEELIPQHKSVDGWRQHRDSHRDRLSFDLDYASKFFKDNQKLLEIGALPFFLTLPLMNKYDVTTLDQFNGEYSPQIVDRYGIRALICDLDSETIPADDGSFDGIIMNEVFEHLRINLIFTMREVLRVLRPGGTLLLSTPNLRSIIGIYNILFHGEAYAVMGGLYENYNWLETVGSMGHTREYTSIELVNFLTKIGFEIDGIIYRGDYGGSRMRNIARHLTKILPQFKPFFSIVARKPSGMTPSFDTV